MVHRSDMRLCRDHRRRWLTRLCRTVRRTTRTGVMMMTHAQCTTARTALHHRIGCRKERHHITEEVVTAITTISSTDVFVFAIVLF